MLLKLFPVHLPFILLVLIDTDFKTKLVQKCIRTVVINLLVPVKSFNGALLVI
jgi:hypothetical protein